MIARLGLLAALTWLCAAVPAATPEARFAAGHPALAAGRYGRAAHP